MPPSVSGGKRLGQRRVAQEVDHGLWTSVVLGVLGVELRARGTRQGNASQPCCGSFASDIIWREILSVARYRMAGWWSWRGAGIGIDTVDVDVDVDVVLDAN